jgi:hypothetical protein
MTARGRDWGAVLAPSSTNLSIAKKLSIAKAVDSKSLLKTGMSATLSS